MRTAIVCVAVMSALAPAAWGRSPATQPAAAARHPHVAGIRADDRPPQALLDAYVKFADAAQAGGDLRPFLLPHAVEVTDAGRPEQSREYGTDISVPFMRSGFSPKVYSVRRDADDAWLVRTGTTAVWFVETKSGGWQIYRYLDKPIQ